MCGCMRLRALICGPPCPSLPAHMLANERDQLGIDEDYARSAPRQDPTGCFRLGLGRRRVRVRARRGFRLTAVSGQASTKVKHWRPGCR
jgi:hypothetical protein